MCVCHKHVGHIFPGLGVISSFYRHVLPGNLSSTCDRIKSLSEVMLMLVFISL